MPPALPAEPSGPTAKWAFLGVFLALAAVIFLLGLLYLGRTDTWLLRASTISIISVMGLVVGVLWRQREAHFLREELFLRKQAEDRIRKLTRAIDQSPVSIVITDAQGNIEYVNPKFCALTGYSFEEIRGQNPRVLKSGQMSTQAYRELWTAILAGREWHGEFHNKKKSGEFYWEFASISAVKDDAGRITHFVAVKEDIGERKKAEAERELLIKSLEEALANVKTLSGLLPICAGCKQIRDDKGFWSQVETYVTAHSDATFTHGLCPDCVCKHYPDLADEPPPTLPL